VTDEVGFDLMGGHDFGLCVGDTLGPVNMESDLVQIIVGEYWHVWLPPCWRFTMSGGGVTLKTESSEYESDMQWQLISHPPTPLQHGDSMVHDFFTCHRRVPPSPLRLIMWNLLAVS
jgi:hypothetical protein